MGIIELINGYPVLVIVLYFLVEGAKALWKHREAKTATDSEKELQITKIVFDMLEASQEGLVSEKQEINKLADSLKRANFEITILERKVSTLMNVIDKCIIESPMAHSTFNTAMDSFNKEITDMRNIKNG